MLRPDQIEDLGFHIANKRAIMRHEPGVGKTPIACTLAAYVWKEEHAKTVWLQPKSLLKKNRKEMFKFTDFAESEVVILDEANGSPDPRWTGPTIERVKKVRSRKVRVVETGDEITACYLQQQGLRLYTQVGDLGYKELDKHNLIPGLPPGGVLVEQVMAFKPKALKATPVFEDFPEPEVVPDLIAASAGAKVILCGFRFWALYWRRILDAHPEINLCLIDETHLAYGGNESQNTLALYESMRHIERLAPMTATLIDGQLSTAFPIIHLIEPNYYQNFNGFIGQHAGWIDKFGRVTQWVNEAKINTILKRHSTFRSFEDAYGEAAVAVLPPQEIEMSSEVRRRYDEFHALAMLELEDDRILDGSLPGVATIRARQIMAHPESFGIAVDEMTGKDEQLLMDVKGAGPTIVFSVHILEQERIVRRLREAGRRVELINGNVSASRRAAIDLMFANGEIDDIVASPLTASVGFNWSRAEQIIFVTLDYKDVSMRQAYGRGLRGVRETKLLVRTYLYENSVDQRVLKINVDKSHLAARADSDRKPLAFAA